MKDATELLMRTLGVTRRAAENELGLVRGTFVILEWLRVNFSNVIDADMKVRIKYVVRTYLLYLVECTLFSNKSGPRVCLICYTV